MATPFYICGLPSRAENRYDTYQTKFEVERVGGRLVSYLKCDSIECHFKECDSRELKSKESYFVLFGIAISAN